MYLSESIMMPREVRQDGAEPKFSTVLVSGIFGLLGRYRYIVEEERGRGMG